MAMQGTYSPAFGGEESYERWKEEIAMRELICGIEKKKQALLIALSLPVGPEVRDKVFYEVKTEDLDKGDGMKLLLEELYKWYKRDEMSAAYEAWTRFDHYEEPRRKK